jgi:hypothetical protein
MPLSCSREIVWYSKSIGSDTSACTKGADSVWERATAFPEEINDGRGRTRVGSGPDAAAARVYRVRSPQQRWQLSPSTSTPTLKPNNGKTFAES